MNKQSRFPKNDSIWWAITIGCFCTGVLWWAGVILVILNTGGLLPPLNQGYWRQKGQPVRKEPNRFKRPGSILAPLGAFLTVIGAVGIADRLVEYGRFVEASDLSVMAALLILGLVVGIVGLLRNRKAKRFSRLYGMTAGKDVVSIHALADAVGEKYEDVCKDLQDMINDRWYGPHASIDVERGRLMITGIDVEPQDEPEKKVELTEEEKILRQIRADNDLIDDAEISRKIDVIGELTKKIFAFAKDRPDRAAELHTFMNYYLPQTLKLLESYARLEAQGIGGENIDAAKQRISGMLDKLADSYQRQLDRLFAGDVMDITSDIAVMEAMLAKDGLAEEQLRPEK